MQLHTMHNGGSVTVPSQTSLSFEFV